MHWCLATAPLSVQNGAARAARCAQAVTHGARRGYLKLRGPWLGAAARARVRKASNDSALYSLWRASGLRTRCLSDVVSSEKKSSAFRPWPCSCAAKPMPRQLDASRVP